MPNLTRRRFLQIAALSPLVAVVPTGQSVAAVSPRIWWGALCWRAGMTHLVLSGFCPGEVSTTLDVYLNGNKAATTTLAPASAWLMNINTSHATGDTVLVEVRAPKGCLVQEVYGAPYNNPYWAGPRDEHRIIHTEDIECDGFTGTRIGTVEIKVGGEWHRISAV